MKHRTDAMASDLWDDYFLPSLVGRKDTSRNSASLPMQWVVRWESVIGNHREENKNKVQTRDGGGARTESYQNTSIQSCVYSIAPWIHDASAESAIWH